MSDLVSKHVYIGGFKIFKENGELYIADVHDKSMKTTADIVLTTGRLYKSIKRYFHCEHGPFIYVGDKLVEKIIPDEVFDEIKDTILRIKNDYKPDKEVIE